MGPVTDLIDPPLYVVLNSVSGAEDGDASAATIAGVLREAGRVHELRRVAEASQLDDTARRAVADARAAGGAVIAAGGDGTLNAVACAVLGSAVPYGVIPRGTFNYFARSHGIPTDAAEATRALLDARVQPVPVGLVNGRPFLVNASVGLYPEALDAREEQKQRHGRSRGVALWATVLTALRKHRPMRLTLERDGRQTHLETLTLFVGLNRLQLEQMGWDGALVEEGRLAGIVLKPVSAARLLWVLARGALGQLPRTHGVDSFAFTSLTVRPAGRARRAVKVATDGETTLLQPPLEFSLAPEPLLLLTPRSDPSAATTP
jgi:diacylglycerol kinase family enzyme